MCGNSCKKYVFFQPLMPTGMAIGPTTHAPMTHNYGTLLIIDDTHNYIMQHTIILLV